jgi:hypothetical protein
MRYSVSYDDRSIPCVVANDRTEVIGPDIPIWAVSVRLLTTVTSVQLRVGRSGRPITMRQGNRLTFRRNPTQAGIYLDSAAGGGAAAAEILVVTQANDGDEKGPAFEVMES